MKVKKYMFALDWMYIFNYVVNEVSNIGYAFSASKEYNMILIFNYIPQRQSQSCEASTIKKVLSVKKLLWVNDLEIISPSH